MKKYERFFPLLIASALLLAACGSAGSETASETVTTEVPQVGETEAETEPDPAFDGYTEPEAVDYNGSAFVFWYNGNDFEPNQDVAAEGENGDVLNDAVFRRNQIAAEKYNISIESAYKGENLASFIKNTVLAGDHAADAFLDLPTHIMTSGMSGYLYNLAELPNLQLDRKWWDSVIMQGTSVGGVAYIAVSSMNIHAYGATPVVVFNKKIVQDMDLDNFYDVMDAGDWTIPYMISVAKTVIQDVDGNGEYDLNDRYGLIANNFSVDCLIGGSGYKLASVSEDGVLTSNLVNETFYDIYDNIRRLTLLENGAYLSDRYLGDHFDTEIEKVFEENRALFWITNLKGVQRRRNMTGDFGVLPMPKATESQDKYYAHPQLGVGDSIGVPSDCPDPDKTGRILEDLARESYKTVIPAFYEATLIGKSMRDEESARTLDVLFDNYHYDIGCLTGFVNQFRTPVTKNDEDIVSWLESKEKTFIKSLDKLTEGFRSAET